MRHFMMDVWIWTEDKHSKPLKTIRFEQDHFLLRRNAGIGLLKTKM